MPASSDIYLTLASNTSMGLHPDNTLTLYVTALPQRINLVGQFESGFVETQWPLSWYNVRDDNSWFTAVGPSRNITHKARIEGGYYDRPERLVDSINNTRRKNYGKESDVELQKITQKLP